MANTFTVFYLLKSWLEGDELIKHSLEGLTGRLDSNWLDGMKLSLHALASNEVLGLIFGTKCLVQGWLYRTTFLTKREAQCAASFLFVSLAIATPK